MMEQQLSMPGKPPHKEPRSSFLHFPAYVISVIFHPLFVPTIATYYLTFMQPGIFTGISVSEKLMIIARVAYNTIFFPALTIFLLRALGFIKSIFLRTKTERIIPYVATNLFYFWMYLVFRNQSYIPSELTAYIFGIFITSSLALLANIYFKISMHALGMGSLCGLALCIILLDSPYSSFVTTMTIVLLTGVVCSSRLLASDHTPFHIYTGLAVGIVSVFMGFAIVM